MRFCAWIFGDLIYAFSIVCHRLDFQFKFFKKKLANYTKNTLFFKCFSASIISY